MADILVHSGDNLAAKVATAVSGDNVIIDAGVTFDVSSPISLHNHGSSSNPITIKSANFGSLSGRVLVSDAVNMPRIRATSTGGAFVDVAGGNYWRLHGLDITDNTSEWTGWLLDLRRNSKTDVLRCLVHPKETNPTWERAVFRGIWYEGMAGLLVEDSRVYGFVGYAPGTTTLNATVAIASIGGRNVNLTNNFISAWYACTFTGGGSGANAFPTQTATFSGSPSMSSAVFSNTTGLVPGQIIRIDWLCTGTKSGSNFTQTAGTTLDNSDVVHGSDDNTAGVGCYFAGSGFTLQAVEITAGDWAFLGSGINNIPSGSQSFEFYQAVRVSSVVGSTVNFTPYGQTPLTRAPATSNCRASWVTDGIGDSAANWTVEQNEFHIDPEFAHHQQQLDGNIPKGIFEWKHMVGALINGNRFTGYPSFIFLPSYSNDGTTPWSTTAEITISNNFFDFEDYSGGASGVIDISLVDPYHSSTPGYDILIFNNLAKNTQSFLKGLAGDNVQVYHNTIINDNAGISYEAANTWGGPTTGWVFRDNIVAFRDYGAQCFFGGNGLNDCWPSGTWSKNVVVDLNNVGVTTTTWGSGSILSPVPTTFSAVGFVDSGAGNYRLSGGSNYKGAGTAGADPGIDQDALEAALAGEEEPPVIPPASAVVRGRFGVRTV